MANAVRVHAIRKNVGGAMVGLPFEECTTSPINASPKRVVCVKCGALYMELDDVEDNQAES